MTSIAGAAMPAIRVLDADVGLVDAGPVNDHDVRDHEIERVRGHHTGRLAHPIADHLAAAEHALVAVGGAVALDARDQIGVAESDRVAGRRPVDRGVRRALHPVGHRSTGIGWTGFVLTSTRFTVLLSPGSKRTAVPDGMSRRMPSVDNRSKSRARLVSMNG
jgi:hypothetical protein